MISKRAAYRITLLVIFALFLFYPFETTVVPEWKVRLVDAAGNPVRGVSAKQGWRHYSIEIHRQEQSLVANDEGYVTFPRRTVRAGFLWRAVGSVIAALKPHGQTGPDAFIDVQGSYSGSLDYSPGEPLTEKLVVRRLE